MGHHHGPRILFICKKKVDSYGVSYGLLNSATFVVNAMRAKGIEARIVSVIDANGIDREVAAYRPTHVMIEAIWVVPKKFRELKAIHPSVKWAVRVHSKTPFLANEGNAVEWIKGYVDEGIIVAPNSTELTENLTKVMRIKFPYLPNIYCPLAYALPPCLRKANEILDVGCFGAIRPMKNHLMQALVAIRFSRCLDMRLRFHVNSNRVEQRGDSVIKNLRALFSCGKFGELVEHPWVPHEDFLITVGKMDIGMQISLSESFNIVTADFVASGVPIVVSNDVDWMPEDYRVDPTIPGDMLSVMRRTWRNKDKAKRDASRSLREHNKSANRRWLKFLGS
jgi:glycosyltransferase involved in cell wall biosynthesis